MSKRSLLETYGDILESMRSGSLRPTHIMYKANLDWTVMQHRLKELRNRNLIEIVPSPSGNYTVKLTPKGIAWSQKYREVREAACLA